MRSSVDAISAYCPYSIQNEANPHEYKNMARLMLHLINILFVNYQIIMSTLQLTPSPRPPDTIKTKLTHIPLQSAKKKCREFVEVALIWCHYFNWVDGMTILSTQCANALFRYIYETNFSFAAAATTTTKIVHEIGFCANMDWDKCVYSDAIPTIQIKCVILNDSQRTNERLVIDAKINKFMYKNFTSYKLWMLFYLLLFGHWATIENRHWINKCIK